MTAATGEGVADLAAFRRSLAADRPPDAASPALEALWRVRTGDWDGAHRVAAAHEGDRDCALVHAHLHRVEGDERNARWWYRKAGVPPSALPPDREWEEIARRLLEGD